MDYCCCCNKCNPCCKVNEFGDTPSPDEAKIIDDFVCASGTVAAASVKGPRLSDVLSEDQGLMCMRSPKCVQNACAAATCGNACAKGSKRSFQARTPSPPNLRGSVKGGNKCILPGCKQGSRTSQRSNKSTRSNKSSCSNRSSRSCASKKRKRTATSRKAPKRRAPKRRAPKRKAAKRRTKRRRAVKKPRTTRRKRRTTKRGTTSCPGGMSGRRRRRRSKLPTNETKLLVSRDKRLARKRNQCRKRYAGSNCSSKLCSRSRSPIERKARSPVARKQKGRKARSPTASSSRSRSRSASPKKSRSSCASGGTRAASGKSSCTSVRKAPSGLQNRSCLYRTFVPPFLRSKTA